MASRWFWRSPSGLAIRHASMSRYAQPTAYTMRPKRSTRRNHTFVNQMMIWSGDTNAGERQHHGEDHRGGERPQRVVPDPLVARRDLGRTGQEHGHQQQRDGPPEAHLRGAAGSGPRGDRGQGGRHGLQYHEPHRQLPSRPAGPRRFCPDRPSRSRVRPSGPGSVNGMADEHNPNDPRWDWLYDGESQTAGPGRAAVARRPSERPRPHGDAAAGDPPG